jgi:DNA-directed RNA polymerase subunit beta'
MEREGEPGEGMLISDMTEVHQALEAKAVTLHFQDHQSRSADR